MSTLVMVKRDGEACMAAETMTSFGSRKQAARYVSSPEKIIQVNDSYVGIVGWSVTQTVLQSIFANGCELPEFRSELELFEFARELHVRLKDEYFLNPREDRDDPYESSQMTAFVMNRYGLFGLYSLRSVERYERFAAVGSGSRFALGAMYAAYESGAPVEDVARIGVEAGIEFDDASMGPITLKKLKLEARS
ncbi:MAG: MFS transporter [Myxococcota bacterium]|nr:MFS transporter [Myxococcota bacterium]